MQQKQASLTGGFGGRNTPKRALAHINYQKEQTMSFREALDSASYEFTSILADEILDSEYNALALFISMASDSTCPAEKLKYDGAAGTILRQVLERSLKTQEDDPECDEEA